MTETGTGLGRTVATRDAVRDVARDAAPVLRVVPRAADEGVRLFLVAADALARAGIRALLDQQDGISVVGDDEPGPRALAALRAHDPDVLVLHGMHGMTDRGEAEALVRDLDASASTSAGAGIRVLTVGGSVGGTVGDRKSVV